MFPLHADGIFSRRNTRIMIALAWMYALGWFILLMTPVVTFEYDPSMYAWGYCCGPAADKAGEAEFYQNTTQVGMMGFFYICIFIKMKLRVPVSSRNNHFPKPTTTESSWSSSRLLGLLS